MRGRGEGRRIESHVASSRFVGTSDERSMQCIEVGDHGRSKYPNIETLLHSFVTRLEGKWPHARPGHRWDKCVLKNRSMRSWKGTEVLLSISISRIMLENVQWHVGSSRAHRVSLSVWPYWYDRLFNTQRGLLLNVALSVLRALQHPHGAFLLMWFYRSDRLPKTSWSLARHMLDDSSALCSFKVTAQPPVTSQDMWRYPVMSSHQLLASPVRHVTSCPVCTVCATSRVRISAQIEAEHRQDSASRYTVTTS